MKNFISRPEISFWLTIIVMIIGISGSYFSLKGDISLQNQKLDQTIALLQEIQSEQKSDKSTNLQAMNRLESHVCTLDTIHQISCISH